MRIWEREEVDMRWIAILLLVAVTGFCAWGLVRGFALLEARLLFLAFLVLSAISLVAGWGRGSRQ
jgi:hypothetical protein